MVGNEDDADATLRRWLDGKIDTVESLMEGSQL
jgi:hypothetical protein